jgi:cytochrome c-type biogenesis protein CcmH
MPAAFAGVIARVRDLAPDHPEGLFFAGMIAARNGDADGARDLWGRLIGRLPADSPVRAAIEKRLATLEGN